MKKTTKIFFFLLLLGFQAIAQSDSLSSSSSEYVEEVSIDSDYSTEDLSVQKFDRAEWKKLTENIDYTEEKIEEEDDEVPELSGFSSEGIEAIGKLLMYLVIAIGVGALIFIISKLITEGDFNFKRNKKLKHGSTTYDLDEIEENLPDVELKTPIEKAIAEGNYSLAIRLYYLSIIQELSAKEIITWKREKTNFEYLGEMRSHRLSNDFREGTQIFERVWYGEDKIDETVFQQIQPIFLKLLNQAKSTNKVISG